MDVNKMIFVTTQKELIHKYPEAPEEVGYLKNSHRHIFFFRIYLEVQSNDREIEFIKFKHYVNSILPKDGTDINSSSCEMLAEWLYNAISKVYPKRKMKIIVSEDDENGIEFVFT